jgi:hypothetical protein
VCCRLMGAGKVAWADLQALLEDAAGDSVGAGRGRCVESSCGWTLDGYAGE